jgi:hypothetical protein
MYKTKIILMTTVLFLSCSLIPLFIWYQNKSILILIIGGFGLVIQNETLDHLSCIKIKR